MSFHVTVTGSPKNVAAHLREAGRKEAEERSISDVSVKDAIRTAFEAGAAVAESTKETDWNGAARNVYAKVVGHIGTDGNNNLTIEIQPIAIAVPQPQS